MTKGLMRVLVPGVLGVVAGACVMAAWLAARDRAALVQARVAAFAADSAAAAADSTRAASFAAGRAVLADSERAVQRRIVQVQQRADSLDRALGLERAARVRVEAVVARLEAQAVARVTPRADSVAAGEFADGRDAVRRAEFVVDQAPYHVQALVELPPAPARGRMDVRVELDTARFEARVGCAAGSEAGVRAATLTLKGPAWVAVRIGAVEQEPRVCSPPPAALGPSRGLLARLAARIQVGVGYAVVAGPGGLVRGPGVAVTWRLARP